MTDFWRWLFGISAPPSDLQGGTWSLSFNSLPQGPWAVAAALGALLAIGGVWWLYRREGRGLSLRSRLLMASLRLLIFATAAAMLMELVVVLRNRELVPSSLPVIIDISESMSLADPYTDENLAREAAGGLHLLSAGGQPNLQALRESPRLALAQQLIERLSPELKRGRLLSYYSFASHTEPLDDLAAVRKQAAAGAATSLGDAMSAILAKHRGQPMAGVLVLSDGRSNAGEDPLKIARQFGTEGVPVYALALGTSQGPRNVHLVELETSPVVFVRDPAEISAIVESRGLAGQTVAVTLEQRPAGGDWSEVGNEELVLGEDGQVSRVTFRFTPDATGQVEFRARTSDIGPELSTADNVATTSVRVVRQKIRVLLVAGYPSPEFQFLRNALLRDERIEFASWLQSAGEGYEHVGHRPIRRLPATLAELEHYDVLVMFDPNMSTIGTAWPELITKFVGDAGGGLVYIAGEQYSRQLLFPTLSGNPGQGGDNSWVKVMPIVCDPGLFQSAADARLSARETWALEVAPAGFNDPIFRFKPDAPENREVIASLPGMFWHFPVTRAKPGATVLARHGDPRMQNNFGRHVLMAMHLYGPGHVVFIGFDSTYRWRYLHEEYFDGYWARLIDRVGRSKVLGGRYPFTLSTDKNLYRTGDRVTVRAQYSNAADIGAGVAELAGEVELADHPPSAVALAPLAHDATIFETGFPVPEPGDYTLRVSPSVSGETEGGPRAAMVNFRVEPPRQEVDNPTWNKPLLDDLARLTDGKSLAAYQADQLPPAIRIREVERVREFRDEIWDAPFFYAGLVMLLTTEWVLRKLFRMLQPALKVRIESMIAVDDADQVLQELEPARKGVFARLKQLRSTLRRQLLLEGIAWMAALGTVLAALALLSDWLLRLELSTRLLLLGLGLVAIGVLAWRRLAKPLAARLDLLDLTAFLERRQPGLGNRVATVLQLPALLKDRVQASPAMVRMAVDRESAELARVNFIEMLDRRRRLRFALLLSIAFIAPVVFYFAAPAAARLWSARWFLGSRERWPQKSYLSVVQLDPGGKLLVPRGEPVVVQVESHPEFTSVPHGWRVAGREDDIVIRQPDRPEPAVPAQVTISYTDPVAGPKRGILTRAGETRFRYELPPLAEPLDVEVAGGDDWLGPVRIEPIDRPAIESLVLLARAPGRSDGETERFEGAENPLLFLRKTALELRLKSRQPLFAAALSAKEAPPPALERLDDQTYIARWEMEQPLTLEIQMTSQVGRLASRPAYLSIGLLKDREPRVTVRSSGVGRRVSPRAKIPLEMHAADDFGLAALALEMERTAPAAADAAPKVDSTRTDLERPSIERPNIDAPQPTQPTEADRATTVALAEYGMPAGSLVKLRGAASDACHEGTQTGVSRWLNFQVVAAEELFYDILMRQRAQRTKFGKTVEMMQAQTGALESLPAADAVPGLLRAHQVIARQTWEVGNRLEATLVEMQLNELGTPQALELLESKVIKPLRTIYAGPLTQLRPLLDALATPQAGDAIQAAKPLAAETLQEMQRILAQMSQWESFVDVMNQLEEISKLEKSLLDQTEQKRRSANQDLFDE